ncbi:PREDICTED: putative disease resistance RPP13-like protein 1 [Lupinus angustifolius]|uniref:putative disease resistance RPP13-like protein 1 n=1 Tax=Lupinus angustifolius TaxID=3871 RepID=UPI00092EF96C|nr:PREDICTED: putative disease resistance RPP13-like protein 1 [Lupinus angustifolius]
MAVQLVARPFMGVVFNVLLEKLAFYDIVNLFQKKKINDKLLKRLKIVLLSANVVLNDAEDKQMKNEAVKEWIEELKDVTFDVDDIIGEIYTDAKVTPKVEERSIWPEGGKEVKMGHKTPTTSVIEACDVYGSENDQEILVNLLLSNDAHDENIGVIPIIRMEFDICKITKHLLEVVTSCSYDIEDLNSIQRNLKISSFKHAGAYGSKIIVTTRSGNVTSIMQTVAPYNLGELSNEDCWNLFSKYGFNYGDSIVHQSLEKVGREIVRKCKGLPLVVKTLAGLLRSKTDRQEWYKVLNSEIWDLQDHESNILSALRFSFHYLHSHLKRCFAYCALFSKYCEFEKEKKSRRNKSCFLMHHLVNDLAQFVSGTFSVRMEGNKSDEVKERTRHLSHIITDGSSYLNVKDVAKANCLHTFSNKNDRLPNSIGILKHILYIEISNTENTKLPESICSLYNLQTLKLVGCYNIIELSEDIHKLVNLRYLDIRDTCLTRMPVKMSALTNLQKLRDFFVGEDCGSSIGELGEISNLHGTLSIHRIEYIVNLKDPEHIVFGLG